MKQLPKKSLKLTEPCSQRKEALLIAEAQMKQYMQYISQKIQLRVLDGNPMEQHISKADSTVFYGNKILCKVSILTEKSMPGSRGQAGSQSQG